MESRIEHVARVDGRARPPSRVRLRREKAPIRTVGRKTPDGVENYAFFRAITTGTMPFPTGVSTFLGTDVVGEVYLADISEPLGRYASESLYLKLGPIRARSDIVRLAQEG